MSILVQKFGGTSVATVEKIQQVARIITAAKDTGDDVVAVVSAMGKTTDSLVELANQVMEHPAGREFDALLATGEMVTAPLLAMAINALGYEAVSLNGGQAGMYTENLHNRARILEINTERIHQLHKEGKVVIVTGFQGTNEKGDITTMGRGGSDTSAVALAGALNAKRCDIYTDVRGVFSTDPRIVPEAVKMDRIAYIEMMELARVGAKVLHPRAVEAARQGDVTVMVRSTFELDEPGTLVVGVNDMELDRAVAGIACDENQIRVALTKVPDKPGIAAEVFGTLANHNISVDMIIQSLPTLATNDNPNRTNDIAFTVNNTDFHQAKDVLESLKDTIGAEEILVEENVAKVSIVGAGMVDRPGIAADMFRALSKAKINIRMISTSEIKISCLVQEDTANGAVKAIHEAFFPEAANVADVLVDNKLGY